MNWIRATGIGLEALRIVADKIFTEGFPDCTTGSEIDSVKGNFPNLDEAYVFTGCIKGRRELVEFHYAKSKEYLDDNFLIELKKPGMFHQRTWEMYLASTFVSRGLRLQKVSRGPDFCIKHGSKNIWVEAVAPGRGEVDPAPTKPKLVPGVLYSGGGNIEDITRPKILRITSATKYKYDKYLDNIATKAEPFIIAINGHDFSGLAEDPDYLVKRAFLGLGPISLRLLSDGTFGPPTPLPRPYIEKHLPDGTKEKIATDFFLNKNYEYLSGVIYSGDHIINTKSDLENIGSEFVFLRNRFAKYKLPGDLFSFGKEWIFGRKYIRSIDRNRKKKKKSSFS